MTETSTTSDITYKHLQKNVMHWNRTSTHNAAIYIFGLAAIATVICYSVIYYNKNHFAGNGNEDGSKSFSNFISIIFRNSAAFIMSQFFRRYSASIFGEMGLISTFGGILMLGFLLLIRWIPKICTWLAIIILGILAVLLCYVIIVKCIALGYIYHYESIIAESYLHNRTLPENFWLAVFSLVQNILIFILLLTILSFCIKQTGVSLIAGIIQISIRAMFFFPSLILFGLLMLFLHVIVAFFMYLSLWYNESSKVLFYITVFGSVYMSLCIHYFGRMVISQAIGTWHWIENKNEISRITVLRSIAIVSRYHLGAVFFAATVILPIIVAIVVVCKQKFQAAQKSGNCFVEIVCKAFLIFNIADYAVITTSLHGCDLFQAIKRTFQLMVKKCALTLAVIHIFSSLLLLGPIIFLLIHTLLGGFYTDITIKSPSFNDPHTIVAITQMIFLFFALLESVLIISGTAVYTTLLCTIEDDDDRCEEQLCHLPLSDVVQVS